MSAAVIHWLEQNRTPAVCASGVGFESAPVVVAPFSSGLPPITVANTMRHLADTFRVLELQGVFAPRVRWVYARGVVEAMRRADNTILALFVTTSGIASKTEDIDRIFAAFEQTDFTAAPA